MRKRTYRVAVTYELPLGVIEVDAADPEEALLLARAEGWTRVPVFLGHDADGLMRGAVLKEDLPDDREV